MKQKNKKQQEAETRAPEQERRQAANTADAGKTSPAAQAVNANGEEEREYTIEELLDMLMPGQECEEEEEQDQEYKEIVAQFDKALEEIDRRHKDNERRTQELIRELREGQAFVDAFLNEED